MGSGVSSTAESSELRREDVEAYLHISCKHKRGMTHKHTASPGDVVPIERSFVEKLTHRDLAQHAAILLGLPAAHAIVDAGPSLNGQSILQMSPRELLDLSGGSAFICDLLSWPSPWPADTAGSEGGGKMTDAGVLQGANISYNNVIDDAANRVRCKIRRNYALRWFRQRQAAHGRAVARGTAAKLLADVDDALCRRKESNLVITKTVCEPEQESEEQGPEQENGGDSSPDTDKEGAVVDVSHTDESVRNEAESVNQDECQDQDHGNEHGTVDDDDADGISDRTLPANGDDDHSDDGWIEYDGGDSDGFGSEAWEHMGAPPSDVGSSHGCSPRGRGTSQDDSALLAPMATGPHRGGGSAPPTTSSRIGIDPSRHRDMEMEAGRTKIEAGVGLGIAASEPATLSATSADDELGYSDFSDWEDDESFESLESESGFHGDGSCASRESEESQGYSSRGEWSEETASAASGSGGSRRGRRRRVRSRQQRLPSAEVLRLDAEDAEWAQAEALRDAGQLEAAEKAYRDLLHDRQTRLGPLHEDVVVASSNLAGLLRDLDRPAEAEALYRRALDSSEQTLGADDATTLAAACNLADLLQEAGRLDAAEEYWRKVLDGRERVLGPEHPHTLSAVLSLGLLQQDRGQPLAAESLLRRALEGDERMLGKDHPTTVNTVSHLASVLVDARRMQEAADLSRRALVEMEKRHGPSHEDTIFAARDLVEVLRTLGDDGIREAECILTRLGPHMDPAERRDAYHSLVEVWVVWTEARDSHEGSDANARSVAQAAAEVVNSQAHAKGGAYGIGDGVVPAVQGSAPNAPDPRLVSIADFCDECLVRPGAAYGGALVVAEPYWANETLENGEALRGNIALIGRGACPFVDKALRAQEAGAVAVLMVNDVPEEGTNNFVGGELGTATLTLPVFGLSHANGEALRKYAIEPSGNAEALHCDCHIIVQGVRVDTFMASNAGGGSNNKSSSAAADDDLYEDSFEGSEF